jgi:hypothetical protein
MKLRILWLCATGAGLGFWIRHLMRCLEDVEKPIKVLLDVSVAVSLAVVVGVLLVGKIGQWNERRRLAALDRGPATAVIGLVDGQQLAPR